MPTPLNRLTTPSHVHSSPESLGERPRPSPQSPSVGSKRNAASAQLDALSPRTSADSSESPAEAPSPGPDSKRPRLALQALSRLSAGASVEAEPVSSHASAGAGALAEGVKPEPPVLGRHFNAHESHRLEDIMHRLRTLHHDYGSELTPKSAEQLKREIGELHQIAKMVLDVKRRLMRRMK